MGSLCNGKQRQTKGDLEEICGFLVSREVEKNTQGNLKGICGFLMSWEAETEPRRPRGDLWIPCATGSRDRPKQTSRRSVDSLCYGK